MARTHLMTGAAWAASVAEQLGKASILIHGLEDDHDAGREPRLWTPEECSAILQYLGCMQPHHGDIYCKGDNATCGLIAIYDQLQASIAALAQPKPPRRRIVLDTREVRPSA